jgi:hypothetical protein
MSARKKPAFLPDPDPSPLLKFTRDEIDLLMRDQISQAIEALQKTKHAERWELPDLIHFARVRLNRAIELEGAEIT